MKRTVKPSPIVMILFAAVVVLCTVEAIRELIGGFGISIGDGLVYFIIFVGFLITLYEYISQDKIEFDESGFTVKNKSYSYSGITKINVESTHLFRYTSTLKIELFKGEEKICFFKKTDSGAVAFIAQIKNNTSNIEFDI